MLLISMILLVMLFVLHGINRTLYEIVKELHYIHMSLAGDAVGGHVRLEDEKRGAS